MSVASPIRLFRVDRRAQQILLSLLVAAPLNAQLLDWEAAIAEVSSFGDSVFTEVEAYPGNATLPDLTIACGHFTGNFQMGPHARSNPDGQDGIVVLFEQDNGTFNWDAAAVAHASSSTGIVEINDITPGPGGQFFVVGTFTVDVTFSGSGTTLTAGAATEGFVAWGDAATATFDGAFITAGMEPRAIAVDDLGGIYITGGGELARKYPDPVSPEIWSIPTPPGTDDIFGIALSSDPFDPNLYVLYQNSNGNPREVVIEQRDRNTGAFNWRSRVGGPGGNNDFPGGIAVGPDHDVRVAFSSQSSIINFESPTTSFNLPNIPSINATHGVVLRIDPTGELVWSTPLGIAQNTAAAMKPASLAVDEAGNTYCAAGWDGNFVVESVPETGNTDTAVLAVDATGLLFDFHRSTGPGFDSPTGVAAPTRELVVTVGSFTDGNSVFGPFTLTAPANVGETRAFIAPLGPVPSQELLIITPDAAGSPTIPQLISAIHEVGGQVYKIIASSAGPLAVSAYLTTQQLNELQLQFGGTLLAEPDTELIPSGSSSDCGWALNHLNDATNGVAGTYSYAYPDTANTVNVYVLDTAVDNSSGWFGGNANLTLQSTTLVRGIADPLVSSVFQHGTEMLSLVAGPDTGAALGTPLVVKNFDFYPNGAPSTSSLLADAVYQAIDYHLDFGDCAPGVILISSSGLGSSFTVSTAIAEAITEGIPVVVSAGNDNADAAAYLPASDGATAGVICVGASKQDRTKEGGSNHTTIDLSAPGDAVRVIDYSAPLGGTWGSVTGTSASAALTAGVAAAHLSVNPWSTPAELETALCSDSYLQAPLDIVQLAAAGATFTQTYDVWTAYYGLSDTTHAGDDDGDGWCNLAEFFHGLKPTVADPKGAQAWITYSEITGKYTYTFNIATALLDTTSLGTMLDGGTYEVTDSTTAIGFTTAPGSLSVGSSTGRQTALSLENTVVDPKCFFQLDLTPASPSP